MSHDNFISLSEEIQNRLHAQANFQFVMFIHILKHGPSNKTEICLSLSRNNNNKDPDSFRKCPVFNVLIGKKFVKLSNDLYDLHPSIDLTPNEKLDLIKILQEAKLEWENK